MLPEVTLYFDRIQVHLIPLLISMTSRLLFYRHLRMLPNVGAKSALWYIGGIINKL